MLQLTDADKVKVCALILAGEPLPAQWKELLFPGSVKLPELAKPPTEAVAQTPAQKLLYTICEAAAKLSVKETSIRKFINDGRLRRVPNFRHVLISGAELQRFVKSQ